MVATNAEFDFSNASLKANQVLLQLGLLLFECADLVLELHIFDLLLSKVAF